MAYRIATNGDNVEFNNGPLSGYTFGGYTAAMLVKRNTLGGRQGALFIVASGFGFPHFEFGFAIGASNAAALVAGGNEVIGPALASTSLWYLIVVTGTSNGTPRFHVHDGTSWSHTAGSGALTALASIVSTDRHFLSPPTAWGGEYLKADVVCQGIKKADSTDLQVETLSPTLFSTWQGYGFDWLVGFETSATIVNRANPGVGNEIARTGTSLVADPSGWSWAVPTTDSGTLSLNLTASATETPTHVYTDTATTVLALTPHTVTAYIDSGNRRLSLTPSATEVYTTAIAYVDSGSTYLTLTPYGIPSYWDSATIPVGFLVTTTAETYTHPPAVYTDASTVALKYTAVTTHECIAHLRIQFEAETRNKWQPVAYKHWDGAEMSRRWVGEVTSLPVSDPC